MNAFPAILVHDRDTAFREALKNFLLAAGYLEVEAATTRRAALLKFKREYYGHIMIGATHSLTERRRWAMVAQQRQPHARVFFLISAKDQPFIKDAVCETVIKEYVYSNLLTLMQSE